MICHCKRSVRFFDNVNNVAFTIIKNNVYECKDYLDFIQAKDDNGYIYLFSSLKFFEYFYTENEIRKMKLKKLNENSLSRI